MSDPTESIRRQRCVELAGNVGPRADLEARYGQVWDTEQLVKDFEGIGFLAPYVAVRRRVERRKGSLEFQASPRFYFSFTPY